jgi:hypothetical protein
MRSRTWPRPLVRIKTPNSGDTTLKNDTHYTERTGDAAGGGGAWCSIGLQEGCHDTCIHELGIVNHAILHQIPLDRRRFSRCRSICGADAHGSISIGFGSWAAYATIARCRTLRPHSNCSADSYRLSIIATSQLRVRLGQAFRHTV